ncbi:MAG: smalltalk protein [Bacteroidaceae bacterium]|nr:smalltalk protein [Bacteroidaceae bacterium]
MNTQSNSFNWGKLLKVLIAVLTALAGSLGLASCV